MSATDVKFGISRFAGALIESVETTDKVETKELRGSDGNFARVHTYNPTADFSVKGHGEMTLVPGGTETPDIDGFPVDGYTVLKELKRTESNDDFDGWEISGTNYPNAEVVV